MTDVNVDIKKAVEEVLSSKEKAAFEEQIKASLEEAEATIKSLTASLSEKSEELAKAIAAQSDDVSTKEKAVSLYQLRIGQLEKELTDMSSSNASMQKSLDYLKSIADMNRRVKVLEDKGIMLKAEAFENQKIKVASLSDTDFESYVTELVTLKTEFAAVVPTATASAEITTIELTDEEIDQFAKIVGCDKTDSKCVETVKEVAARVKAYNDSKAPAADTAASVAVQTPPPAKLDPKAQVMASLNLEVRPDSDMISKYAKLGEALAKRNARTDNN